MRLNAAQAQGVTWEQFEAYDAIRKRLLKRIGTDAFTHHLFRRRVG